MAELLEGSEVKVRWDERDGGGRGVANLSKKTATPFPEVAVFDR